MKWFEFTIRGLVQGVGYRPFVARLAKECGLAGDVRNAGGIVKIRAGFEDEDHAHAFAGTLYKSFPAGARVESVETSVLYEKPDAGQAETGFSVTESADDKNVPVLPADIGICPDCLRELNDPKSRFYKYPFISCAACGPRASIMRSIPYDRINTTMDKFDMCPECAESYRTVSDRRFYAQTISCHNCGPVLWLREGGSAGNVQKTEGCTGRAAFTRAVEILREGGVITVKNVGGYHLVCDAGNDSAVRKLRELKKREAKPFAVLVKDIRMAEKVCEGAVGDRERELLESAARPVVLVREMTPHQEENPHQLLSPGVSVNSPDIGLMLPANALQYMLAEEFPVLVMTSANYSGEPMIADDEEIMKFNIPVLGNDREILTPLDDSVMRVVCGRVQCLRRSRGFVPEPVRCGAKKPEENGVSETEGARGVTDAAVFAAGADMKSSFAFYADGKVYPGRYLGDLENLRVQEEYVRALKTTISTHMIREIKTVVTDLHPGYVSANIGKKLGVIIGEGTENAKVIRVQHHMAHAASVIAEHGICRRAVCFSFDGTGYGTDGNVWGGEVFVFNGGFFTRADHLDYATLPGGDEGARNANLSLAGYMHEAGSHADVYVNDGYFEHGAEEMVYHALDLQINSVKSTSCGRLFDAVAALLGICTYNGYEGQCACELEYAARKYRKTGNEEAGLEECKGADLEECKGANLAEYKDAETKERPESLGSVAIFKYLLDLKLSGADPYFLANEFHELLAEWILETSRKLTDSESQKTSVILSGGCFANRLLTELAIKKLEAAGFLVYTNEQVPPGDDGIAVGQIYLAERL